MACSGGGQSTENQDLLAPFLNAITGPGRDPAATLRAGLIGEGMMIDGPFGPKPLLYADHAASGRALRPVEDFILEHVLPWHANCHTQASACGARMNALRAAARAVVARLCGAGPEHAVIFTGSGATAGLNRLVHLLGVGAAVAAGQRPLVLIGPYEHHSNILPWRESGAEVVELGEDPAGGPDLAGLERILESTDAGRLRIAALSAASNVTGIVTDTERVTRVLRRHGVRAVWDYAGGGPYLPIAMTPGADAAKDAVVLSPHKFPGGPGSSGILIVRRDAVRADRPSWPGGGTVGFVSPWDHSYLADPVAREEAGTPNAIADIRAALALLAKDAVGQDTITAREAAWNTRALAAWRDHPRLDLLGVDNPHRLPIFSFRVRNGQGGLVHHQLFTRLLSDRYGIQARGGCACAGPYAHRLLGIDQAASTALTARLAAGEEVEKPGWVRLNFSYLMTEGEVDRIIDAVATLAWEAPTLAEAYEADPIRAVFRPRAA
ncbi:MAG: hypothetical protein RLY86_1911 [Pseudomonadota bacterium]|jgi:selenocysteine lyase/cysteine desulfurase